MKNNLNIKDKKGISEIVSYVILIIISIGLAALAYPTLKLLVLPPETPACPENVFISIDAVKCDQSVHNFSLVLNNRGLFNISGAYVYLGNGTQSVRKSINNPYDPYFPFPQSPGTARSYKYDWPPSILGPGSYIVEVRPFVYAKKNKIAICTDAAVIQQVQCA